jgi:hypothetical protein
MVNARFFITIIFISLITIYAQAQQFFRIKTDYTVKYTDAKGNAIIQIGVVYYDIHSTLIVMKNGFPIREIIAQKDTSIYHIRNNYIHIREKAYSPVELSIFHLALIGELEDYGLKKAGYTLDTVKEDKGLILTIWSPPQNVKSYTGKILVSVKDKKLFGIVFLDANEKIIAKHFFRKYTTINGFYFPSEILRLTYMDDQEISMLTSYSKIVVNGENEDEYYNFKIPDK